MIIFPAIDIIEGQCVRLKQGDFDTEVVYNASPLEVAKDFEREGAQFIHVVDLDAAKSGNLSNLKLISKIISALDIPIEVGGGIRDVQSAKQYMQAGVGRLIIGTAALEDEELLSDLCLTYPDKISLGVDVKDEYIYTHGWTKKTNITIWELLKEVSFLPLASIIVTDIDRDGMLNGPNFKLYEKLCEATHHNIVVSGGISSLDEIERLCETGVYGVVVGKALYEGKFTLPELLDAVKKD